jgi:hypothetical protein
MGYLFLMAVWPSNTDKHTYYNVMILPFSYFGFKENIGWQAVVGTVLPIAGVAVLFLA